MPNYTFKCQKCGKAFEKSMTFDEYDKQVKQNNGKLACECGGQAERTWIMDSLITHYKCDGFYDTDSKTGRFRVR